MKAVIHSPKIGGSKKLLDHGQVADQEELDYPVLSETVDHDDSVDVASSQNNEDYVALATELQEENQILRDQLSAIQEKYENLVAEVDASRELAEKQGYQEGIEQAEEKLEAMALEKLSAGEAVIDELKTKVVSEIYDQEDICLEIVFSAICRLIGDSAGSKQQIKGILKLAMDKIADPQNLNIYVSPHDYEQLSDDEFVAHNIIRSDDIVCGGCLIKTGKGSVEAKLDSQLSKLKTLLLNIHKTQQSS